MPRKSRGQVFGVFDEQAVSVLEVLSQARAKFGALLGETRLSKASLYRVLRELEKARIVKRSNGGYEETVRGKQIMQLVHSIGAEHSTRARANIKQRLSQMEKDYRRNHRVFHSDARWERTSEKPLVEVMAVLHMTGPQSLMFHQTFEEEVMREEQRLRGSRRRRLRSA